MWDIQKRKICQFQSIKGYIYICEGKLETNEDFYSYICRSNPKIAFYKKEIYPAADLFFNIALTDERYPAVSIAKLYIGHGDELSEGNPIFYEKHQSSNNHHIPTLGVPPIISLKN